MASAKAKGNVKVTKPTPPPSAYATLCSAVARLATEVGYQAEEEILRIPSTRNTAIVGRLWRVQDEQAGTEAGEKQDGGAGAEDGARQEGLPGRGQSREDWDDREDTVRRIVRQELGGRAIEDVGREWRERVAKIAGSRGTRDVVGHEHR